jgi:hypothetical protein
MVYGNSVERLHELIDVEDPPKQEQRVLLQAWVSPVVAEAVRQAVFGLKIDKRVFVESVLAKACVDYFDRPNEEVSREEGP